MDDGSGLRLRCAVQVRLVRHGDTANRRPGTRSPFRLFPPRSISQSRYHVHCRPSCFIACNGAVSSSPPTPATSVCVAMGVGTNRRVRIAKHSSVWTSNGLS
ncbi:hypothetical protein CDEST_02514 [Colletotrichum destructivum]|uniref:Uncharacterized protein n=1 Tax=Colletotrichum destructivum TaxID=34406 RepID=A0AAX4I2A7_9PEZI|nr:hypothetical protein CDEST_02514 [Colletotrichum destructivum]